MKKLVTVACLCAGCVYGMNSINESDLTTNSSINMQKVEDTENAESTDKSIKIDIGNPDLIGQWQNVADTQSNEGSEDNIFDPPMATYKEGRFWTIVKKVFQPMQIVASASTMVMITTSKVIENDHPSIATGLSYGALGSAMTSGVLSLFITKLNSRINKLNKIYKAKLAEEKIVVDIENV